MNFFFDRNLPERLARMLDAYDPINTVTHQDDDGRFDHTATDVYLLMTLAADTPKPVFMTADINIHRKNPSERKALKDSELTVVFLRRRFHSQPIHTQAVNLLKVWPEIVKETARCKEPTAFELTPSARKPQRIGYTKDL